MAIPPFTRLSPKSGNDNDTIYAAAADDDDDSNNNNNNRTPFPFKLYSLATFSL